MRLNATHPGGVHGFRLENAHLGARGVGGAAPLDHLQQQRRLPASSGPHQHHRVHVWTHCIDKHCSIQLMRSMCYINLRNHKYFARF